MKLRIAIGVAVLLGVAAWFAWQWMTGPLYQPGDVRAGKGLREPLTPVGEDNGAWKVAPDVSLFHFEHGAGEDVLTVAGGPGFVHLQPWNANSELASNYRFHYYHQRGCGKSSRPITQLNGDNFYASMMKLNAALGLGAQVADIERIRRLLGRDKLILAGHSFGALIAALYAAEFPEHVRALVFISPANLALLPNPQADVFSLIRGKLPPERLPEYERFLAEYFDFKADMHKSEQELAALYRRFGLFYSAVSRMPPPQESEAVQMNGGYMSLAVFLSMGKHHDYRPALRKVSTPVLVIHGSEDLQPREWSLAFADLFPRHKFVEIGGAGHFSFDEKPAEFAAAMTGFLSAL